jgi:ribosome recycling factor
VPIPALNEERRAELSKVAGKYAEQAKISVRNVRRDGIDQIKKWEKDSVISKDDLHNEEKEIQKLTDKVISEIDEVLAHKEQEIMQV